MSRANVHMSHCKSQEAKLRLFPHILAIHPTISSQNSRLFIYSSSFWPHWIAISTF